MAAGGTVGTSSRRLLWLDVLKGVSILWIVYFHLFQAANDGRSPDPLAPDFAGRLATYCAAEAGGAWASCIGRGVAAGVTLLGYHAVGVFRLLSGVGLGRSLGDVETPSGGWGRWYRRRLLRLYPLYWTAHLLLAVSPFTHQPEPIDYRFVLSFLGIRVWPIDVIHLYFNPAWWYFALLVQLYAVFPLLWWLLRRLGPAGFALAGVAISAAVRWVLFEVWPVHPSYAQGAFFAARMAEFAIGMALGVWHRADAAATERALFNPATALAGLVVYALGILSFRALWSYCFTDALVGTGLFLATVNLSYVVARFAAPASVLATVGAYSYGFYLLHQPYVLYAGPRWHDLPALPYAIAATLLVAGLFLASAAIERAVGRLTERVLG